MDFLWGRHFNVTPDPLYYAGVIQRLIIERSRDADVLID